MKRNYIKELHDSGMSIKKIAQQTGISQKKVSALSHGIGKLSSKTREYENVRNLSRRTAYQEARKSGLTPDAAHKYERIGLSENTYHHHSTKQVHHTKLQGQMQQLKILGEFQNLKTKEKRIVEGVSKARKHISPDDIAEISIEQLEDDKENIETFEDYPESSKMLQEAIQAAQGKLGGSNWQLIRIIDIETITYNIS